MEEWIQEVVATNLRLARNRVGMSQESLADQAGVDRTLVSMIERGKGNPTVLTLAKFAAVLGTTPAELITDYRKVTALR